MSGLDQPTGIRAINQLRILNALRQWPGASRVSIARRTGLGKATVSMIVGELIEQGLVHEIGTEAQGATVGRRPVKLELNGSAYYAVGIELTGNECAAVLADLHGMALKTLRYPTPLNSVDEALEIVTQAVAELVDGRDGTRLLGVGIGIPGTVEATSQRVVLAENLGWVDVPYGALLAERIDQPVILVNRTNAGALGEFWRGGGQGVDNLVYVSVSVGVGAGIIINGSLYEGAGGSAGEIGHMTVDPDGRPCTCGNVGCLETLIGSRAIVVRAKQRIKDGAASLLSEWTSRNLELISGRLVIDAAAAGDPLAVSIIDEAGKHLGIALANVINLFNPAIVVVDGDMLELGDLFLEPIRQTVNRRAFSVSLSAVTIVSSKLRHQAAAIGAASLVINRLLLERTQLRTVPSGA